MSENDQAKAWRTKMHMTMEELSRRTGYSREAIFLFEAGRNSQGKPIAPHAWRRYKLACMAVRFMLHFRVDSIDEWAWE